METFFKESSIYILPDTNEGIWLCEKVPSGLCGKLVYYERVGKKTFNRTNMKYFLNLFKEDDVKSFFCNRENYEIAGCLGINYKISDDRNTIFKE